MCSKSIETLPITLFQQEEKEKRTSHLLSIHLDHLISSVSSKPLPFSCLYNLRNKEFGARSGEYGVSQLLYIMLRMKTLHKMCCVWCNAEGASLLKITWQTAFDGRSGVYLITLSLSLFSETVKSSSVGKMVFFASLIEFSSLDRIFPIFRRLMILVKNQDHRQHIEADHLPDVEYRISLPRTSCPSPESK